MNDQAIFTIIKLLLAVIGVAVCTSKAKKLNRNAFGWGLFGFLIPIVAMIWIQFMKPVPKHDS